MHELSILQGLIEQVEQAADLGVDVANAGGIAVAKMSGSCS